MKAGTNAVPPSPLEAHLGFWLRFVSNQVSARVQQQLEAQGVTVTEWVALRTLCAGSGTGHADLIQSQGMTHAGPGAAPSAQVPSDRLTVRVLFADPEFKRLSQRAGCTGYTVWIAGRHVTYFGRRGETHVERFPD